MTHDDFLRRLVEHLETAGIPYMVVGSIASSAYGEPRSTHHVDVVIDPAPAELDRFLQEVGVGCYVSVSAAQEALRRRDMFNVVDYASGSKADLILRKSRSFNISEFARRRLSEAGDFVIASPEDVILSKLEWSKLGESDRQFRDASQVYALSKVSLEESHLDHWAAELGVADLLCRIRESVTYRSHPEKLLRPARGFGFDSYRRERCM